MESLQKLKTNIDSAENLQSIVGTMKAHATSNINQFQNAANASWQYKAVLDKSLHVIFSQEEEVSLQEELKGSDLHIVFGSDHGLAGRFNERITNYALRNIPNNVDNMSIIIGQQVFQRIKEDLNVVETFKASQTTESITKMVTIILLRLDELRNEFPIKSIILHYNTPIDRVSFKEESEVLFPLDLKKISNQDIEWDSNSIPTYFTNRERLMSDLIQQYFFITLYRAYCYSLASENASRLSSMQAAEKNIEERLEELNFEYRRQRQNSITEELNDVVSGFKAIKKSK